MTPGTDVPHTASMSGTSATVLFVPGLRGHVEDHWQTLLAKEIPGSRTVPPEDRHPMSRHKRVYNLAREIMGIDGDIILVAHSAGVLIAAHWAAGISASVKERIRGALLVTPADIENPLPAGYPTQHDLSSNNWLPIPRTRLPFPAILAASTNDPLANVSRVEGMAKDWGCALENLGDVGHMNPASGYGPWPGALTLMDRLRSRS